MGNVILLESKKVMGVMFYLVNIRDSGKMINLLNEKQNKENRFICISTKEYTGNKHNNCIWVVEG